MAAYTDTFYDVIAEGCRQSAAVVAPIVHDLVEPRTVVDVGCGQGWWTQAFTDLGCETLGIDGSYVSPICDRFTAHDLTTPLPDLGRFDLAVSLEVAEHLPATRAVGFVADLCALAPTILFSAAIPGQGGTGHVNEQWPGYWADLFARNGYTVSGGLRWRIWDDDRVENWYRQNLLIATAGELPAGLEGPHEPFPVVHPVLFDHVRSRR